MIRTVEKKYPMVGLVVAMIDKLDPNSANHSIQVTELSWQVCKACNIFSTEQEKDNLLVSALLHDVGKVAIPEYIRTKPGRLTEAEYWLMKQHPRYGYEILSYMNGTIDPIVKMAILYHHENFDGTGYPENLRGEDIPMISRVIRICDTFDAIVNSRGYKMPRTPEDALITMTSESHLYDPTLLECFLQIMRQQKAPSL